MTYNMHVCLYYTCIYTYPLVLVVSTLQFLECSKGTFLVPMSTELLCIKQGFKCSLLPGNLRQWPGVLLSSTSLVSSLEMPIASNTTKRVVVHIIQTCKSCGISLHATKLITYPRQASTCTVHVCRAYTEISFKFVHTWFNDVDDIFNLPTATHKSCLLAAQVHKVDGCSYCLFWYLKRHILWTSQSEEDVESCSNP